MTTEQFLINERIAEGKHLASTSKVVICGLARNNASTLSETLSRMDALGECFREVAHVVYENNSTDDTVSILRNHPYLTLISETIPNFVPFRAVATRKRAQHMAYCRNKYLDIVKSRYSSYDFMIVVDMDLHHWDINSVLHSLSYMNKFDVVSANGLDTYSEQKIYYDIWTLVLNGILQNNRIRAPLNKESAPVLVDSAFGGLAIYHIESILKVSYGAWHDDFGVYGSEHTGLHMGLKDLGSLQAINPFMVVER